jgi:hypothetical protein
MQGVIGRQSCFQWYSPQLVGSYQGQQDHAPADDAYAS